MGVQIRVLMNSLGRLGAGVNQLGEGYKLRTKSKLYRKFNLITLQGQQMRNCYMEAEDQLFSISTQLCQVEIDLNSSMRD